MVNIKGSVGLVGYGVSNKALCAHLMKKGIFPVVRCPAPVPLPTGITGVFGDGYLEGLEETVFRSPGVHPHKIGKKSYTEVEYGLGLTKAYKIGVTGSDGKTTTSTLIHLMLSKGSLRSLLSGNIGTPIVDAAPLAGVGDYLVCELSSFQLYGYSPDLDVGVITNISENHLDWHGDMDDYVASKSNILKNAKRCVLNYDCEEVRKIAPRGSLFFSLSDCTHLLDKGADIAHISQGAAYFNRTPLFSLDEVRLKGRFNLQNLLCAALVTYPIVGKEPIAKVAREFGGVENRMEQVATIDGVTYICSAIDTTPKRTVETLSAFDISRVIAILGGSHKGLSYESLDSALRGASAVILCGENSGMIEECLKRRTIKVNTLAEAVSVAHGLATEGDFVILTPASASFDMFENYKEKANCFKKEVRGLRNGRN